MLATLLPTPLLQRLAAGQETPPVVAEGLGSVLYIALDGITALAERLMAGGRPGAEALRRTLDGLYAALVETVEAEGGAVLEYTAGSLIAVFEAPGPRHPGRPADDVQRAFACALALLPRLTRFLALETPTPVKELRVRAGVGAGQVTCLAAPQREHAWFYTLAGDALDEALAAHAIAQPGEVVAGPVALGLALGLGQLGFSPQFGLIAGTPTAADGPPPAPAPAPALDDARAAAYLPPPLVARAQRDGLRGNPVHAALIVLRLPRSAPAALGAYLTRAAEVTTRRGGWLSELCLANPHATLVAVFCGADLEANPLPAALDCAQALHALAAAQPALSAVQIGVAHGRVFAGAFGSARRRCFVVAGAPLAEARRLAESAPQGAVWLAAPDAGHAQRIIEGGVQV